MDIALCVSQVYPNAEYNPACFNFSEEEAREKKLWRDPRPMPTREELNEISNVLIQFTERERIKIERKAEYEKSGLFFSHFIELLIEDDQVAIAEFRRKRNEIKTKLPKP